jgi:transcriptional regulator with XRE-family HTH domain
MIQFRRGFHLKSQLKSIPPELEQAALFWGMYSRLAKKLGVSPQAVRQVARGITSSERISKAIRREVARLKATCQERAA